MIDISYVVGRIRPLKVSISNEQVVVSDVEVTTKTSKTGEYGLNSKKSRVYSTVMYVEG